MAPPAARCKRSGAKTGFSLAADFFCRYCQKARWFAIDPAEDNKARDKAATPLRGVMSRGTLRHLRGFAMCGTGCGTKALISSTRTRLAWFVERFEAAWQQGHLPAIQDFLPAEFDGLYRDLLIDLVQVDLERRLNTDRPVRIEDYMVRFPELAQDRVRLLDLIMAEYEVRRRGNPALHPGEYGQRFPSTIPNWCSASLPRPPR
jgi:hypothetical protein